LIFYSAKRRMGGKVDKLTKQNYLQKHQFMLMESLKPRI
jgi:hypothetical protein